MLINKTEIYNVPQLINRAFKYAFCMFYTAIYTVLIANFNLNSQINK